VSGWTDNGLAQIGAADELQIASYRQDGTLRLYTTNARYPDSYVQPMVEPDATAATFRLVPR